MNMMNKTQVDELFRREAVLIGSGDAVPIFRVAALFGEGAAEHARRLSHGRYLNGYGVGDYTLMYILCLSAKGTDEVMKRRCFRQ